MGDTYCGKLCEDCQFKDNLQCPGCKTGPGKTWMTECELAKCCIRLRPLDYPTAKTGKAVKDAKREVYP